MKWFKRISLIVVIVLVLGGIVTYVSLNGIVRSAVERQASASLNVPTTLGSADLSIFGGSLSLGDLQVGSPPKFTAPHMFTLNNISLAVHYGQLTGNPVRITSIEIDNPTLVIEQQDLKLNIQALTNQPTQTPQTSTGQPTQPTKLIIDSLKINNAKVSFMPGLPGLSSQIDVPIASLSLTNIGNAAGAQNGVAIRDVVVQIATALAKTAAQSGKVPLDLNKMLDDQLDNALNKVLGKNASPELNNQIQQGIQGLFGTKNKNSPNQQQHQNQPNQ